MRNQGETTLSGLTHPQLLRCCAAQPEDEACWSEFISRFNPLLVRSITSAWRRYTQGEWPASDVAADLLQDCYAAIIKDDCHLLRSFRGASNAEVEAYLAHAVIHQTISYLRARGAQKRQAELVSWEGLVETAPGEAQAWERVRSPQPEFSSREMVQLLQHVFSGPQHQRDILIFLLHARDGWSATEIAAMGLCELKSTSIANLLSQMKARLKKYFANEV